MHREARSAVAEDSGDFEAVFESHYADVLIFAMRRVGNRSVAEDVVAETFAVAWRHRDDIPEAPLGWLYGVARKVIGNERRSTKRRARLSERLSRERDGGGDRGDPAWLVDHRDATLAAFSRLPASQRDVLMLVAWEGVDAEVGSRVVQCTPAAFRVRLHRARRALERELLEKPPETLIESTRSSTPTKPAKETT